MGTLDGLLRIKQFREGKAERELVRARLVLEEASAATERARDDLRNYEEQCRQREQALYQDLMSRVVHKSDLDDVELDIKLMREQIPTYQKAIDEAVAAEEQARQGLAQARLAHQDAIRMREKFTELVSIETAEQVQEALRVEDNEMEEVRVGGNPAMQAEEAAA
ncbi:MAG: type secretion protein [Paucimonas sp.]|nr:type secretion protein [Paucimonas sp.]